MPFSYFPLSFRKTFAILWQCRRDIDQTAGSQRSDMVLRFGVDLHIADRQNVDIKNVEILKLLLYN
jgi:hypothetical protein